MQTRTIDRCLRLHGSLCAPEMMSFHETLMRFFRTNFHDEIQRLPVEGISELEDEITVRSRQPMAMTPNEAGMDEWPGRHGRTDSLTSANGANGQHMPTTVVGQASFFIPPLAFGQVPGAGLPPPTPGGSRRQVDAGRGLTPLQRNLARLTRYGMSSITSGPGDRSAQNERAAVTSDGDASPQGSFVNVGRGEPSISRLSMQATAKDVASSISAARSRISRMASLTWRRNG